MAKLDKTLKIVTQEMHTGGEPLRIIGQGCGYPPILGSTILEKRAYVRDNLDHLRRLLMYEPRGHYDMYGAVLVNPKEVCSVNDREGGSAERVDIAVLFMHNEGYSTMCGHAVVALGSYYNVKLFISALLLLYIMLHIIASTDCCKPLPSVFPTKNTSVSRI